MAKSSSVDVSASSPEPSDFPNDLPQTARSRYEKVHNFFGFTKAYNFPLCAWVSFFGPQTVTCCQQFKGQEANRVNKDVIFAGAMFGFSLSRLQDFNYDKIFAVNINPGYMYYFATGSYRVGMILHLAGCLPAGLLMALQFLPVVRHSFPKFHRINGYIVLVLLVASNIGACISLRHNDSGTRVAIQSAEALLVILTTSGMAMAYYNIKRLQIDQHRAWMIRTMFYFGVIISSRVIDNLAALIISRIGTYYTVWTCDEIDVTYQQFGIPGILEKKYLQCLIPNGTVDGRVVVKAVHTLLSLENAGSDGSIPFGAALWISLFLHLVGVEIYLNLTPRESERLRQVSYERQLAAGFKNPGSAGTTVDRFGDAEKWTPSALEV